MEYECRIEKTYDADVLVIGGGPAGFGAAIAASRNGAKTILIDRYSTLGGMATVGLVGPFMTCYDNDCKEQIVKGIFDELCRKTEAVGGAIHPSRITGMGPYNSFYIRSHEHVTPFFSESLAVVMDEMTRDAGVKVLFNTQFVDAITKDGHIEYAIVLMKEGLVAIKAQYYIDCTGDADVSFKAGVPCIYGNGDEANPSSLFFEVDNVDDDEYCAELEENKDKLDNHMGNCYSWRIDEGKKNGEWTIQKNEIGMYRQPQKGRWKVNTTRMANVDSCDTEQVSEAMMEGRRQVQEILSFMRKNIPGCKNVQLVQVAQTLGIRESRHVKCLYELTVEDVLHTARFYDAICTFAYAIDVHLSQGGGVEFTCVDKYYTIPYRSLVPQNCLNLFVAGRCIGGTSEAAASFRVMPACVATGQAAGTAAAIALKKNVANKDVPVEELVSTLKKQGAVIK